MHDCVITFGAKQRPSHWPGWSRPDGTLVDLRLIPRGARDSQEREYDPARLREAGVPESLILAAGDSTPRGFILISKGDV